MFNALEFCKKNLTEKGVEKFQCSLDKKEQHEMNLEGTDFTLIRTTQDNRLNITVINDNRKGSIFLNQLNEEDIQKAVDTAIELSNTSPQDPDFDIAPKQNSQRFQTGPAKPDAGQMYDLLKEFTKDVPRRYPAVKFMDSAFSHNHVTSHFINSNGVDFVTDRGVYGLSTSFSSREGEKTTSFNYSGFTVQNLDKPLLELGSIKILLEQSVEHLNAKPFQGKFDGDIILTPDCLDSLIYYYTSSFLRDGALIMGTSPFKDKLGKQIANEKFTLFSKPVSPIMASGYFVTDDGFVAENTTVIENGVLNGFLLSQYGSKKTGLERAKNQGGCWVIEPGAKNFEELVADVKRGLLVARFSGGNPSLNGDFSGVAKNSYYIEDGKIMYPVTETMISGNLVETFKNIKDISKERIDYGDGLLPYVSTTGITIAGK